MSSRFEAVSRHMRPHLGGYGAVFALSSAVAVLEVLSVVAVVPFFTILLGSSAGAQTGMAGRAVSTLLAALPGSDPLAASCALVVGLTLLKGAATIANERALARVTAASLSGLKGRVLDAFASAPHQFFLTSKQGRLSHLYLTSTLGLAYLLQKVPRFAAEALRMLGLVAVLLWLDPRLTLALVALGGAALALLGTLSRRAYRYGQRKIEANAEQTVAALELIGGIKHLTVFRAFGAWRARLAALDAEYNEAFVGNATLQGLSKPVVETAAISLAFGSILLLKVFSPDGVGARLPMLAGFAMAALRLLPSFNQLNAARLDFMANLPDLDAVDELLVKAPRRDRRGRRPYPGLSSGIRLEGVRFAYPGRPEVLKGVDLEIAKDASVALVGESGSGKTTILNLLLGLERPTAGRLLVDGVDLAELDADAWLKRLAVVTQDGFVFHGSVADNIVFGRSGFDREAVRRAARVAQAFDFIEALPQGFDTQVGERGLKLSGGQQQRLAIARAVLGDPELLIFDEATSALDSASEAAVQSALRAAARGRTVVQVSHRLSTVAGSDLVAVLHEGRVAELGPSSELIARGGRYAALHRMQGAPPAT